MRSGRSLSLALPLALLLLLAVALRSVGLAVHAKSNLACGVCEAIVDEVNRGIRETTATHSVQTRFRVDEKKRIPYARTEHNLLEIMESDDFPRRFDRYGLVKPWTKTARQMREAYQLAQEGAVPVEAEAPAAAAPADAAATPQPAAPETPASTTTTEGAAAAAVDPAAAAGADAAAPAPADGAAAGDSAAPAAAAAAPATPPVTPFRPTGPVPLSLQSNHVHLAFSSLRTAHGLHIESSSSVSSSIRSAVSDFLDAHLDDAVLLFHRDDADVKTKLCSAACKPTQRAAKQKGKAGAKADLKEAPTTATDAAAPIKDEL